MVRIVNLMAENRAIEETTMTLESAYKEGVIDLNKMLEVKYFLLFQKCYLAYLNLKIYIQIAKGYNEKEFDNKMLLKKCVEAAKC